MSTFNYVMLIFEAVKLLRPQQSNRTVPWTTQARFFLDISTFGWSILHSFVCSNTGVLFSVFDVQSHLFLVHNQYNYLEKNRKNTRNCWKFKEESKHYHKNVCVLYFSSLISEKKETYRHRKAKRMLKNVH